MAASVAMAAAALVLLKEQTDRMHLDQILVNCLLYICNFHSSRRPWFYNYRILL